MGNIALLLASSAFALLLCELVARLILNPVDLNVRNVSWIPYLPRPLRHTLGRKVGVYALRGPKGYGVKEMIALKTIFFHIPKTGGLSLAEALFGNRAAGHITTEDARVIFGAWGFQRFFKFCIVRNPWDRLVSAYHYLKTHPTSSAVPLAQTHSFQDFIGFIPQLIEEVHLRPQSSFVAEGDGRLVVDYVGKFEQLEESFGEICARLGISTTLPHVNPSPHPDFRGCYTRQMWEQVKTIYWRDVKMFGYE